MNVATHQEKEKNEKTFKRKAGEDRPILKRLRATLQGATCYPSRGCVLRSFKGLHGKKMVCVRGVPGVTGTLRKANSHFDPTQTGRGLHHHVEACRRRQATDPQKLKKLSTVVFSFFVGGSGSGGSGSRSDRCGSGSGSV